MAKRFYGAVGVAPLGDGFTVTLDGRAVRTPAGRPLTLPTEALARAVAGEWEAQEENVRPHTMPMMQLANAAIDISDGLVADLGPVCAASGMTATIVAPRVPLSEAARAAVAADPGLMGAVLTGGDDYELLFTCAPDDTPAVAALARELDLPLSAIGQVAEGDGGVRVIDADGRDMVLGDTGYRPF